MFAFEDCTGLTSVTIPDSVTGIDHGAFEGCTALKDIYYGGTEEQWKTIPWDFRGDLKNATIHFNSTGTSTATPDKPTTPPATSQTATPTNDKLAVDGKDATPAAYKIGRANYYGLRDLGRRLGFNVGWAAGRGMYIESDKPYTDAD